MEKRISGYERLLAERERLLRARAALTGEPSKEAARVKRVSQDEIAAFIEAHPGSLPAQIAEGLGVPVTNVSAHLYRAKGERFERRKDGWYVCLAWGVSCELGGHTMGTSSAGSSTPQTWQGCRRRAGREPADI